MVYRRPYTLSSTSTVMQDIHFMDLLPHSVRKMGHGVVIAPKDGHQRAMVRKQISKWILRVNVLFCVPVFSSDLSSFYSLLDCGNTVECSALESYCDTALDTDTHSYSDWMLQNCLLTCGLHFGLTCK